MNKELLSSCLLFSLIAAGCATSRPSASLSPRQLQDLNRRAQSPKDLGIGLSLAADRNAELSDVNALPLGIHVELPMRSPYRESRGWPVIRSAFPNGEALALIDTMASLSFTDYAGSRSLRPVPLRPGVAETLLPLTASSPAGPLRIYAAVGEFAGLGDKRVYKPSFGILDEQHGFHRLWWLKAPGPDLVLGHDFLRIFDRVTLDYPRGMVTLSSGKHRPELDQLAAAIAFIHRDGMPVIVSHLDDKGPFQVGLWTSGPTGLWLPYKLAEQLALIRQPPPTGRVREEHPEGFPLPAATLNLGGFQVTDVDVTVGWPQEDNELPYALLGNKVLRHYAVTFDFKAKKIYLENP